MILLISLKATRNSKLNENNSFERDCYLFVLTKCKKTNINLKRKQRNKTNNENKQILLIVC